MPEKRTSCWQPPPDSDLVGIPLVLGLVVAVLAVIASFVFLDWFGFVVLLIVLIGGLALSFHVISASDVDD